MGELWNDIPGYEGAYAASNLGRIKSLPRKDSKGRDVKGRILLQSIAGRYPSVHLYQNGAGKTRSVHILVALAFIGPRPDGKDIAHIDGDVMNAALSNLRYASKHENEADKLIHGTRFYARGETNGQAKLNENQVREILQRHKFGKESQTSLAKEFGVDQSLISHIARGVHWRHIEGSQA